MTPAEANGWILLGLLLLAAGGFAYRFARPVASFTEHVDAVGSKRRGKIQPADWKVSLYRYGGAVGALLGAALVGRGLLSYVP